MEAAIDKKLEDDDLMKGVYKRYRTELCNYITRKYSIQPGEAEDVVHSAFARFSEVGNIDEIRNPRAFLYKACNNAAIDMMRRANVRENYANSFAAHDKHDCSISPERETESKQRLSIISRALKNMPDKRRKLLMMHRFDGLSYAEIARRVGLSETVVRKHVAKALVDCHAALNLSNNL